MILKKASAKAHKYAIMNYHYSKRLPVGKYCSYSVFNKKNQWCGVITFGGGATPTIGMPFNMVQGEVVELVRVALNGKQESTSKAIALSLKLLKKQCPSVKLVISYADKGQNHLGIIYQATNWLFIDESKSSGKEYFYNGKWTHQRTISLLVKTKGLKYNSLKSRKMSGKLKYIYPLNKNLRKNMIKLSKPYIKNLCDSSVNGSTLSVQDKSGGSIPTESLYNYV